MIFLAQEAIKKTPLNYDSYQLPLHKQIHSQHATQHPSEAPKQTNPCAKHKNTNPMHKKHLA